MKTPDIKTILLVEDEAIIAINECRIISEFGYNVLMVNSGKEAVDTFENNDDIDMVLMDIDLGSDFDGPSAAEKILEIRKVPILFLTSHYEKDYVEKVKSITRYGFIIKNSGNFILESSIEMAFQLFESNRILAEKELELQQNQIHLYKAQEIGKSGHFSYSMEDGKVEASPEFYKILCTDLNQKSIVKIFSDAVISEDKDLIVPLIKKMVKSGDSFESTFRIYNKNGGIRYIHAKGEILGGIAGKKTVGVIQDISEQKFTEIALKESEERFQNLFEQTPLGYQSLDENGCFLAVNLVFEQMLGYSQKEITGTWFGDLLVPECVDSFRKRFPVFKEIGSIHSEFQMIHKNGTRRYISFDGKIGYNPDGSFKQTHCILSDETDKHKEEENLKQQELRYHEIFSNIHAGIAVYKYIEGTNDFIFTDFNPAAERIENESKEILVGKSIFRVWPGIEKYSLIEVFKRVLKTGIPEHCPLEIRDNKKLIQFYENYIFRISSGEIVAVFEDVTSEKTTEIELIENKTLFSLFMDYSPVYTFIKEVSDRYSMVLEASSNYHEMLGISRIEMIGKKMEDLFPAEFAAKMTADDQEVVNSKKVIRLEEHFNGRTYDTIKFPILHSEKKLLAGYTIDITPQKEAEKKINDLLEEKELILKEVHHRIKNNMTTVRSLLNLQAKFISEPTAINALNNAAGRVQSMLILYDKLYQSDSYHQISIRLYFDSFLDQVVGNFPNASSVKIIKNVEDIVLDSKRLSTLSIIINELVTNIMKYAFKPDCDAVITFNSYLKGDMLYFEIQDNGSGIPQNIDFEHSEGFGLMLVNMLTQQIEGKITIERKNGTKIILIVPE